jgi:hypothetical protein
VKLPWTNIEINPAYSDRVSCSRGLASVFARVSPHYSVPEQPPDVEEEPQHDNTQDVADAASFKDLLPSQQQVRPEIESHGGAPASPMDVDTATEGHGAAGSGADEGRGSEEVDDGGEEAERPRLSPVHSGYHGGALKRCD